MMSSIVINVPTGTLGNIRGDAQLPRATNLTFGSETQ